VRLFLYCTATACGRHVLRHPLEMKWKVVPKPCVVTCVLHLGSNGGSLGVAIEIKY
jgi:hypothetical protein